jgi:hypothetical protein
MRRIALCERVEQLQRLRQRDATIWGKPLDRNFLAESKEEGALSGMLASGCNSV